jgi:hypothetical protein
MKSTSLGPGLSWFAMLHPSWGTDIQAECSAGVNQNSRRDVIR